MPSMLIDMHVHTALARHPLLARANGTRYPAPERLLSMMDAHGIDKAAVMATVSPECRYSLVTPEEVLSICGSHPDRLIPFCSLDPRNLTNDARADFRPLLAAYRELGCRGIGEFMPNMGWDDPRMGNLLGQVEESGLPLTFHLAPAVGGFYGVFDEAGLPGLERSLRAFPRLRFIGHSQPFWAEIGTDVIREGRRIDYPKGPVQPGRTVQLFRAYPNLYGDLSAGSGFGAISRDPEFGLRFLEEFADRLFFATDIANETQDLPIVEHFRGLAASGRLSRETFEKITWRNAVRVLGLPS
jgi:uncharacterized protein